MEENRLELLSFRIYRHFDSFNDVLNKTKTHWSNYSTHKKKITEEVAKLMSDEKIVIGKEYLPLHITFNWIVKDRRRDLDNISFNKKAIIDGMVDAKALSNDGLNEVSSHTDTFEIKEEAEEGVIVKIFSKVLDK